jgi:hypothetical protein
MAKLNPGSVAAIVQAGIVVLVLGAGSYMVSSRLNRTRKPRATAQARPMRQAASTSSP